jgi:hypothetical protein
MRRELRAARFRSTRALEAAGDRPSTKRNAISKNVFRAGKAPGEIRWQLGSRRGQPPLLESLGETALDRIPRGFASPDVENPG